MFQKCCFWDLSVSTLREHCGLFCASVSQPYWTVARIVVKSLVSHRNHLLLYPSLTIHTFHLLLIGLTSHCMSVIILGQNIYHISHKNIDNISPLSSSLSSTLFLLFFFYFLERNNNAKTFSSKICLQVKRIRSLHFSVHCKWNIFLKMRKIHKFTLSYLFDLIFNEYTYHFCRKKNMFVESEL